VSGISTSRPSNRSFGILFTFVFASSAGYALWAGWSSNAYWLLVCLCLLTFATTIFLPGLLSPFNRAWFYLGEALGKIVSPIVLGVIFFGMLCPVGLITKLFGRDELRLRHTRQDSYWVDRYPPGPESHTFNNQF
jgi:hypothetical protein